MLALLMEHEWHKGEKVAIVSYADDGRWTMGAEPKCGRGKRSIRHIPICFGGELPAHS